MLGNGTTVILIVPLCILAAMIGVNLQGFDRNILVEIGLVVLVALAAKNAILILSLIHISEPTRLDLASRMPSSA